MMSGKISLKTIIILVILVLVGVLGVLGVNTVKTYFSSAAAGAEPTAVLATPNSDGKSAVVTWTTEKAVQAVVEYGTTPASLLLRSVESDSTTDHHVTLTPLKSGVNYYFRIRVGEDTPYDNNGIPYSFKTKDSSEVVVVQPTVAVVPTGSATSCVQNKDYNNDGVINSLDYLQCIRSNGVKPTVGASGCAGGVDYNGDGTINSLDMIKCLQKK
ncbi:MAG: fibronectin type III domain-containing protein [Candidatus Shapirobacteria bacterium]|nr:fibronectin type III domain-containing protein [Candidatus Shapirobacteria bacterium]